MCGICGIVHPDPDRPIDAESVKAMRDSMVHRGPDDAGLYLAPGVALGTRRLAVVDLSPRGHMPMATPDGRYWITYNGEIYNFPELRSGLESRGIRFRSTTDTEVLLALYVEEGSECLHKLNGMFAFAVWDVRDRRLFLARDRLGVKPLYYAVHEDALYFASEAKALFTAGVPARFDAETWEEILCFRYVSGERTPYAGVRRLLPGHHLTWKDGRLRCRRWWHLGLRAAALREQPPAEPVSWFRDTLDGAIGARRISDVPLGVLLSGGLDSSSVAASLAMQAGPGVASFTVRFSEPHFDEGRIARQVAERWQLQHHELIVPREQLLERLRQAAWFGDEPPAHANALHLLAIAQYAKPRVTVLLSGEGGDEALGGYVRYRMLRYPAVLALLRPLPHWLAVVTRVPNRLEKLVRFANLGTVRHSILFNACELLPSDLTALGVQPQASFEYREQVLEEAEQLYPGDPLRHAMYSDLHTFLGSLLDRNDRMTMAASIECRTPFLDYRLIEGVAALPTRVLTAGLDSKSLLRHGQRGRLPDSVLRHHKWGFGVPWNKYMREIPELREIVAQLAALEPICDGPFDRTRISRIAHAFLNGDVRFEAHLRRLLKIAVWYDACFAADRRPAPALAPALPGVVAAPEAATATAEPPAGPGHARPATVRA